MIKGKRRTDLTEEEILKRISSFDIYKKFFGTFTINKTTYNHLRGEKEETPSFIIGNRYGDLLHHDFSAGKEWSGNCFHLVEQIYGCGYDEALRIIDKEFSLGIVSGELGSEYKKITSKYKQPEAAGKRYSLIQVNVRKFTNEELKYWNSYHQDISDLKREQVYSIKELFLNRKRYNLTTTEIRFGYFYEGGWWKIYFPFREKKRKWISNVPIATADGLDILSKEHNTLIAKSKKDKMVCRKVHPYTCAVQNESLSSFSEETISHIQNNSKSIFYGGDSDESGKKASYDITEALGFKHINPPDRLLPDCNDFACWSKIEGLDKLEEHFKIKGLL